MNELTYKQAIENAAALKQLGQTTVHLWREKEPPWHIAGKVEPGGTHRLDMATSVWFSGSEHGLTFKWSFDIEDRNANGKGAYQIDVEGCQRVIRLLKGDAQIQFKKYLADCAVKVKARGDEYQRVADAQFEQASVLRSLVNYPA